MSEFDSDTMKKEGGRNEKRRNGFQEPCPN